MLQDRFGDCMRKARLLKQHMIATLACLAMHATWQMLDASPSSLSTSSLAQGFFSLSQARYSMGYLGQQQYDMDMQASAVINIGE